MRSAFFLGAAFVFFSLLAGSQQKKDTTPIAPTIPTADRYQEGRIFLERADELKKGRFEEYQIVVGNVMFRKGDMFMYCDSAHFYDNPGAVEAYGNVHMEQGDTLFVYADELFYSDTTQLATLYATGDVPVRLINRDVTLTTDIFNYDMGIELGYYEVGGHLNDKKNTLDSRYGEYSPRTKDALFSENVTLNSIGEKDTLTIYSDLMLYNTMTHIAILDTTSTIISADGTIYTTQGTYNTETSQADLYERSTVVAKNGNTLVGDTLYYDREAGFGQAFGNIELTDTTHKVILTGDYGFYFEKSDSARVYGNALAREYSSADTLYLHGDTIRTYKVITPGYLAADSTFVEADSTHYMIASPRVKFFRSDLAGLCDSLTFVQKDSMMYLNNHPVVWNETRQIFGNVIEVHMNDSTADWAKLPQFGFMAEFIDDDLFNQLTGKEMYATFADGSISHLDVSGNVQVIMLPMENDSTYNKISNVESSFMSVDFVNGAIDYLKMWDESSGTMTPLYMAKKSLFYLPQFRWFESLRPYSPEEVFDVSAEMIELFSEPPFGSNRGSAPQKPAAQPSAITPKMAVDDAGESVVGENGETTDGGVPAAEPDAGETDGPATSSEPVTAEGRAAPAEE